MTIKYPFFVKLFFTVLADILFLQVGEHDLHAPGGYLFWNSFRIFPQQFSVVVECVLLPITLWLPTRVSLSWAVTIFEEKKTEL